MLDSLHDSIVNMIPSGSLRACIAKESYHLPDTALLATVWSCAPNFNTRIEYMEKLLPFFSGDIKAYTARIIKTQKLMLDAFMKNECNAVYELHIKETPDSYDETYLCDSFEAALKLIPLFYQTYDEREREAARYRIVKRRVFSEGGAEAFSEDYLGDMVLLPGQIVYSVDMEGYCAEDCDHDCMGCNRACVRCDTIPYPCFTKHGDAVRYQKHNDGLEEYGINLQWENKPSGECYIIPLDCEQIRWHDFENAMTAHEHIPDLYVEVIRMEELPEKMQGDYLAYYQYLTRDS